MAISSPKDDATLIDDLSRTPSAARSLQELATDNDPEVRDWVVGAAPRVLADVEAAAILAVLALDGDSDISDAALHELAASGQPFPPSIMTIVRKKLTSADYWEPVASMWLAARLRATELLPDIRRIQTSPAYEWHSDEAAAAIDVLESRGSVLLERLRHHEHALTATLLRAAKAIGSPEALAAVRRCATDAPDEDCRQLCQSAVESFSTS